MNQGDSMSDKFQLLLEQIGMPLELRESGAFSAGKIEKVFSFSFFGFADIIYI